MADVVLVAIVDGGGNLPEDPSCVRLAERLPVADVVVQLSTRGYLHHQHHLLLVLKHFVDVNNVWVLNGRHDLDLSSDSDEVGLCLDLALLDCLDCHPLPSFLVDAQLNLAIGSLTKLLAQFKSVLKPPPVVVESDALGHPAHDVDHILLVHRHLRAAPLCWIPAA